MAIKTYLGSGDTFTVADNGVQIFGSAGSQTIRINSGVTGSVLDANIERVELAGNLSTYKFVTVAGVGLQIQDSTGAVLSTLGSLNQNAAVAFADGLAQLEQTATSYTLGGTSVVTGATGAAAAVVVTTPLATGAGNVSTVTGASAAPVASAVTVAATGTSSAAGSNVTFNIGAVASTYTYTITGPFSAGDVLNFGTLNGGLLPSIVADANLTDGIKSFSENIGGNTVTITLTGLSAANDAAIFNVPSFNTVFGAGSLV